MKIEVACITCGKIRLVSKANKQAASKRQCASCGGKQSYTKRNNKYVPSVKGMRFGKGSYISSDGYKQIRTDKKYEREHRLVVEHSIGRKLTSKEVVHHINLNKLDNRIENLYVTDNESGHRELHNQLDQLVHKLITFGIIIFDGKYMLAVDKLRELLEHPEEDNQQPSQRSLEGSETTGVKEAETRLEREALNLSDDIVHTTDITLTETVE